MRTPPDPRIQRYLSGEMLPDEQTAFEQELSDNEALADALAQAEADQMTPEQAAFHRNVQLTIELYQPGGVRDQIRAARRRHQQRRWLLRGGIALAVLALVGAGIAFLWPAAPLPMTDCLRAFGTRDLDSIRGEWADMGENGLAGTTAHGAVLQATDSLLANKPEAALRVLPPSSDLRPLNNAIAWLRLRSALQAYANHPTVAQKNLLLNQLAAFEASTQPPYNRYVAQLKKCLH